MFNIFGDLRSTGPRGPPGYDSFNLVRWAPQAVTKMFRAEEAVDIHFNSKEGSVIKTGNKPVALKNWGTGKRADCLQNFPRIVQIKHNNWMMEMKDSLFQIPGVKTATIGNSTVIIFMTFKALTETPDTQTRFLFSNLNRTRGISVKDKELSVGELTIYNSGARAQILFARDDWQGVLLQYTCIDKVVKCWYMLNDQVGRMDPVNVEDEADFQLYLGGHPLGGNSYHSVGSFDLYYKPLEDGESGLLSEDMGKCLLQDILDRIDKTDE